MYPQVRKTALDDLLARIGANLQLDPTRKKSAESRYKSVTDWLKEDPFFKKFDLNIFPFGSFRLGTTTKPIGRDEYDLDFVLVIKSILASINPVDVLNHLEERLKKHETYKGMISRHKRCVRVNYANEFHLDILPAYPSDGNDSEFLKIPDRDLKAWVDANPKGYAEWFESKYITIAQIRKSLYFEKQARVEDLPKDLDYDELQPVQRVVQLMKRFRDVYFEKTPDYSPKSIILTTLVGIYYNQEETESNALTTVLNSINQAIINNYGQPFRLENPKNSKENFTECWTDRILFKYFTDFISEFTSLWHAANEVQGVHNVSKYLYKMFGEDISKVAIKEQAVFMKSLKDSGSLNMDRETGRLSTIVTPSTIPHLKNKYYGD